MSASSKTLWLYIILFQPRTSASQENQAGGEEDDEEESGDDADLSKYDLWGSDGEEGNSSKMG